MIGYGNDTLAKLPPLNPGDEITCPKCRGKHVAEAGASETGDLGKNPVLFYLCQGGAYLAGVGGKNVVGVPSDLRPEREHWVCTPCWVALNPNREPSALRGPMPVRTCCHCGHMGRLRIPINAPPEQFNCRGIGHLSDR